MAVGVVEVDRARDDMILEFDDLPTQLHRFDGRSEVRSIDTKRKVTHGDHTTAGWGRGIRRLNRKQRQRCRTNTDDGWIASPDVLETALQPEHFLVPRR